MNIRRAWIGAWLAVALSGAAAAGAPPPFPVSIGGPFTLTDPSGTRRSDRDFRGRFMLVFFGYTYCPDTCPTNLQSMGEALDLVARRNPLAAARVQPIFITVDPTRDTLGALGEYVPNFHPRLIGLRGSPAEVRAVARAYRVHLLKVTPDKSAPKDYLVSHGPNTFLMGPKGEFVTLFTHDTGPRRIAEILLKYVAGRDVSRKPPGR